MTNTFRSLNHLLIATILALVGFEIPSTFARQVGHNPAITPDGRFVFWEVYEAATGIHAKILLKDTQNGTVSSIDGTVATRANQGAVLLSLKDMQTGVMKLVSSTDGTADTQGNYSS
jgi:hypothetical protein